MTRSIRDVRVRRGLLLGVSAVAVAWGGVASAQQAAPAPATIPPASNQAEAPSNEVQEVVVTGTLLRRRQEDVATPLLTVDQQQIQKTGAISVGDLTKYIPQNIGSAGGVQDLSKGGTDAHDARSANLRGLGAGATLVLLNGRRVVPSEGFVNLDSMVPPIAIQRVETALGGASAIYGADAVAGVVNIITDKHFEGFDATAQYTDISKAGDYQLQARFGAGGDRFHVVASAAYTYQGNLQNADRSVTNFFNGSSGTGANPGTFTMLQRPQAANGADLVIDGHDYSALYDQFHNPSTGALTVVDPGCGSPQSQSVYIPAANSPGWGLGACAFSFQAQNPLRPASSSLLIHNDAEFDITDAQQIYAEFAGYHQDSRRYGVPSFAQNHNAGPGPVVPTSNPYNPFGVPVQFSGRAIGSTGFAGDVLYKLERDEVNQFHTVLGSKGALPIGDWQYDGNFTWSRSSVLIKDKDTDMNLFQAALNGYGGPNCNIRWNGPGPGAVAGQGNCLYLSPFFKDAQTQDPSLLFNIQDNTVAEITREYLIGEFVANGTIWELPAGKVELALGAQYRREMQRSTYSDLLLSGFGGFGGPSRDATAHRTVRSIFAETNIPIIDNLDLDLAIRNENYGAFKDTSPKAELNWKVIPNRLSLRASYGKSFQAPGIENSTASQIGSGVTGITDPLTNVTTFRTIITLGNPALQPQTAKAYNVGFTVLPMRDLSLSFDWWDYKYENRIQTQNPQAVINADPNGPQVIRDSNGVAQTIIVHTFNAPSGTQTSGIDFAANYAPEFELWGGTFNFRENLTYLLKYDIDTGTGIYNGIGRRNAAITSPLTAAAAPRWRSVLSADWSNGMNSLNVTWRYSSSLLDDWATPVTTTPSSKIKAWSVLDWQYRLLLPPDSRYEVDVGMINAFDTMPGSAKFTGYLPSVSDALGRETYIKLGVHF